MSLKLYMDVHAPGPVTEGLRRRGVDVLTAQEDGRHRAGDPQLLDRAAELSRVFVSQDADLLAEASRRQRDGIAFAGLAYAHQMRITVGRFIDDLEFVCAAGDEAYMKNRVEWLPFP